MVQHLITFVENKDFDVPQRQLLVAQQHVESSRSPNDDMGMRVFVGKKIIVLLGRDTAVEDRCLDLGHIFAEASVFILDLIGKLSSMAHDQDRAFSGNRFDLLQRSEDKDRGFTETRFRLTQDVASENGLRDTLLLDYEKGDRVRLFSPSRLKRSRAMCVLSVRPSRM